MEPNADEMELMNQIHEGMRVVDVNGDEVGKVSFVQFSDPEAVATPGDRGAGEGGDPNVGLLDVLGVGKDDGASERMRETGYVRIDAKGWFLRATSSPVPNSLRASAVTMFSTV